MKKLISTIVYTTALFAGVAAVHVFVIPLIVGIVLGLVIGMP